MSLHIVRNDITKMKTEAIVNTANAKVAVGSGCDYAIYTAAGYEDLLAYRREHIGEKKEGDVFLTPGFSLPVKVIIHAVSPFYENGSEEEEQLLRKCYQNSLSLAKENAISSISFPLISTGGFRYPKEEGLRIAVEEIRSFLAENEMEVYIAVFDEESTKLGKQIDSELKAYIDKNYVEKKEIQEYFKESISQMIGNIQPKMRSMAEPESSMAPPEVYERTSECASMSEQAEDFDSVAENGLSLSDEDYDEKIDRLEAALEDRMSHLQDTFSEYLLYLIEQKNMKNSDVYNRGLVDRKLFHKIKNNKNYHPKKRTILCLCIGARLNLDETKDLLARAGYALSPSEKEDVIFSYFIENRIYEMYEIDIQLEKYELDSILE